MRRYAALCVSLAALAASCGSAPTQPATTPTSAPLTTAARTATVTATPAPTPTTTLVEMGDHFFAPAQLTVRVGTTVTWRNVGQSAHDLAAEDGSFKVPGMGFGETYSFTFNRAGTYPYVCAQHKGDGMTGIITVTN